MMTMKTPFSVTHLFRKTAVCTAFALFVSIGHGQTSKKAIPKMKTAGAVKVYTTALNTKHRLSPVGDLQFQDANAIVERNVFVFVDDTRSFQTMLGIGGAITDA